MAEVGVALHELCCPTCGEFFLDFNLYVDEEESFQLIGRVSPIAISSPRYFLLCPKMHKWTIKMIWRSVNEPDRVQLDRYLGRA